MQGRKEFYKKLNDFFSTEWILNDKKFAEHNSVVIYSMDEYYSVDDFISFLKCQLNADLNSVKNMYMYILAIEEVKNRKSKVELYKKCWKKISDEIDLKKIELGREIEINVNDSLYYSGLGRLKIDDMDILINIFAGKKYSFFISKNDYISADNFAYDFLVKKISVCNLTDDIKEMISFCSLNKDFACSYGSYPGEYAFNVFIGNNDLMELEKISLI